MHSVTGERSHRWWADLLAIVAAVLLIALSLWPSIEATSTHGNAEMGNAPAFVPLRVAAGLVALLAVAAAQSWRWRGAARAVLVIDALVLVAALIAFRGFGVWAMGSIVLPAAALIVAAFGIGPMPLPEEDAR